MYIIKNALRSIARAKGRNILIGIVALIVAVSSCIGLSIMQAADNAKQKSLDQMTVTAQISVDRQKMREQANSGAFSQISSLSLDEMNKYAKADAVNDFYYAMTVSMNGSDAVKPVDSSTTDSSAAQNDQNAAGGPGGQAPDGRQGGPGFQRGGWGTQGDFTLTGYSADNAMTDFVSGVSKITEGTMFAENTSNLECIISDELATYNSLKVGDKIKITNPNNEDETYQLTVKGIYNNSQSTVTTGGFMRGFSTANDAANQIYTSYAALKEITAASTKGAVVSTNEETGVETTTAIPEQVSGTYLFSSIDDYKAFDAQARKLGLDEIYMISSSDVTNFEKSLVPLENLSNMAKVFLLVILGIGGVILAALNIFNIRDRKYEVGVLTAIGMKKRKVMLQFITEIFTVTFIAIVIGTAVGTITSVPVANKLLESQVSAETQSAEQQESAFGRPSGGSNRPDMSGREIARAGVGGKAVDYISEISSATNLTVILELIGIGILLTLIASIASVAFIMRYEPLKILSNRD